MSVDRFHSLPKKPQPTLASTHRGTHTATRPALFTEPAPCPEVAEFRHPLSHHKQQIYIHNLYIDYGRLERPHHPSAKITEKQVDYDPDRDMEVDLETKRVTGISQLLAGSRIHNKDTEKKSINRNIYLDINNTEDMRGYEGARVWQQKDNQEGKTRQKSKSRVRLQEVRAYQQVRGRENGRRVLHSRIVKMVVGGGQAKTRMICYPDNAEYLKLCGKRP